MATDPSRMSFANTYASRKRKLEKFYRMATNERFCHTLSKRSFTLTCQSAASKQVGKRIRCTHKLDMITLILLHEFQHINKCFGHTYKIGLPQISATFFIQQSGALVPVGISSQSRKNGIVICMSRLPGNVLRVLSTKQAKCAAQWLARFHSLAWGNKADGLTSVGLQAIGTYWHFATRRSEWESMPTDGWEGRLRLLATPLHERLEV